jgi:hypothetical protein
VVVEGNDRAQPAGADQSFDIGFRPARHSPV